MKKLLLWALSILLFCPWAFAYASEECPIGYSLFGQIPNTIFDPYWSGYGSDFNSPYKHFDNFWGLSEDICKITWWGWDVYYSNGINECTEDPTEFEVAFYPDDGSGKPDTLNPLYILSSVTPARTPTGQIYGPFGPEGDELWIELNRYEFELNPCVTVTEGWISVMGTSYGGDPEDCWFLWISSTAGDLISYSLRSTGWVQREADVAFCFGGDQPIYGACCNQSTRDCDYVEYQDCPEGSRFEPDASCADIDPQCGTVCEEFTYSLDPFTNYEAGDPAGWHWSYEQGNPVGSAYHPDSNVANGCDDWLISPGGKIIFEGDSLIWNQRGEFSEYNLYHGVLVSSDYVDGSDPTTANWTELYSGPACEDCWESKGVSLSALAGETVHFAFRYQGDYNDRWWVDNVCIFGSLGAGSCGSYAIGDYNGSSAANVADVVDMFSKLKTGDPSYPELDCECPSGSGNFWPVRADVNASCTFNVADVVSLFSYLKIGSPELAACELCPPDPPPSPPGGEPPLAVGRGGSGNEAGTESGKD